MKKTQLRKIIRESIEELMTEQVNHDQVLSDAGCYCPSGHGVYQAGGSACRFSCNNLSDPLLVAALNSNGGNGPGCYYDLSIKLCIPQVFPNGNPVFANDCCNLFESGGFGANGIGSIFNNACDGSGGFNYGFYEGSGAIPGSLPQNSPGTCESECTGPNCTSSSGPCATSTNPNCGSICYACIDGIIYEEDPNYATSPGGGWTTSYSNSDVCGYGHIGAFGSNTPPQPFDPSNSSLYQNQAIWWNSDTNADFTYFGCSYSGGTTTTPVVLNPGCTVVQSLNYDATADGCPDANGVVDVNDVSCCTQTQPGGGVTPINVGPPMASNDTKSITPTPNPNDPQVKRMKDLAFKRKRK